MVFAYFLAPKSNLAQAQNRMVLGKPTLQGLISFVNPNKIIYL